LVDISLTISPLRDASGVIVGASKIARDISARKRAEEHQRALNAELDHRVKNVLATVCAIIDQTQDASSTYADFVVGLDDRIKSLASTHDLLSRSHWHGVPLAEIARREFAPYATGNSEITGPSITLKAEATQAVAMVLHELTTNAAKYGAFSDPNGRVLLNWSWLQNGEQPHLAIDWKETGGPSVVAPSRSGYGTCVVRELIPFELGGTVDLAFASDGLRCRLEIPCEWVSTRGPASTTIQECTFDQTEIFTDALHQSPRREVP
jgi:two-component sensor histidine kinase